MAKSKSSSEHRMLFDIRGKRKRVVQVVYALLALLMGLSLFTVVGPSAGFLGDIFGTNSSSSTSVYDDQAAKLEAKLRKDPKDEAALLQLTRTRYFAGQQLLTAAQASGSGDINEILSEYTKSGDAWTRYMKLNPPKPSTSTAGLAAQSLAIVTRGSTTADEYKTNSQAAAQAQRIATAASPTVNNLFQLASAEYFAFNFAAGDKAGKQAVAKTPSAQRKPVQEQLNQTKKQAQSLQKRVTAAAKAQGKQGKQALQQGSLGGLSGGGSSLSGGGLSGSP